MRKNIRSGFSLVEILVSIAVLAISISGVLAALAFDAFSSEQSGVASYAVGYNRKVMDLVQSGQVDPTLISTSGPPAGTGVSSLPVADGLTWRMMDDGLLSNSGAVANLWGVPGGVDLQRFDIMKGRYRVNLVANRLIPSYSGQPVATRYRNTLVEMIVTTMWQARSGIRFVRLRGFYATNPQA